MIKPLAVAAQQIGKRNAIKCADALGKQSAKGDDRRVFEKMGMFHYVRAAPVRVRRVPHEARAKCAMALPLRTDAGSDKLAGNDVRR